MSTKFNRIFSRQLRNRDGQLSRGTSVMRSNRSRSRLHLNPGIDFLEGRVVLASPLVSYVISGTAGTTVVGTVYDDVDRNGVRSGGENGVSGWTVYLDLDNSGTLNRDAVGDLEPSATTNQDGDFVIDHLMPGTYRVAEVMQSGWEPTAPMFQDVTVVRGRDTPADFFNFSGGDIIGTVWNDLDQDGIRATDPGTGAFTEPGLANWTVFLDLNDNRIADSEEPSTLTDEEGRYSFFNLPEGDYEVTEIKPDTWDVSPGFDIRQTAGVVPRTQFVQDFANFSMTDGSLTGTIWNDMNIDGVRQTDPLTGAFTEPGSEGWTVFLDTNNNGIADPGELSTVTDANGNYSFISLTAGDYEVTEVLPPGWDLSPGYDMRQTVRVRAGERSTADDFANFTVLNGSIRGTVWNDLNRNGVRNTSLDGAYTDPGLANWSVFLDLNRNGAADAGEPSILTGADGSYTFADLQVGDYEVREVLPTGWEPSVSFSDSYGVTVFSGAESVAPDFAVFNIATATPGVVNGTVWNDLNGNGVRDTNPATGTFTDPGLAGRVVFVDVNSNGSLDATEPNATTRSDGTYSITGVLPGSIRVIVQATPGWRATSPFSGSRSIALKNAENIDGIDFGTEALKDSTIRGVVFADSNNDGVRNAGEKGLGDIEVYLDLNSNGQWDAGEPKTATSNDQFYTPAVDEAGTYSFTHLAAGTYVVRTTVPALLSATAPDQLVHTVILAGAEDRSGVDTAARYRSNEIHGLKFDDLNGNHLRDPGEPGVAGATIYIDLDRDDVKDDGEPTTVTQADGSYVFGDLTPGAYVVRQVLDPGHVGTYPGTVGGVLWPQGVSNPAVGNVSPGSITTVLSEGESFRQSVSITMPDSGALTNLVDVFLLFDDTGSFVNNSPIVRSAFPAIISQLQFSLPGIDLGFGVGRFEEYANFASEYSTGRPFILNQPIVAASTTGYMDAIQFALNRTTPGYGGDQPETDIEALYQLVTGLGFDGNNNGSVLDSGPAGLVSTQINPGSSGDVPSFASFTPDPSGNVLAAAGNVGGGGFRAGALPIFLVATDTGFAYQPMGETTIIGVGGVSLPISAFTQTSRPTTPFNSGAGIQQTITALNALGGLVIGLGTNTQANVDPRQGLESLSRLTGAVNRSTSTIANGTADPIAPGDPFYFQITSGFASSVSSGIVNAIQNAVTNVAVDITVQASDPRVRIVNHTGVRSGVGSAQTATFDIEFVGDGVPHRFDLQFVRAGTNVILGSIPVVIGTNIPGDCYEFEDLSEGEIEIESDFGTYLSSALTPPTITVTGGTFTYDGLAHEATATATGIGGVPVSGSFAFTYDGSSTLPVNAGTYTVLATFTSNDINYSSGTGTATLIIGTAAPAITVTGGSFVYDTTAHEASAIATGIGGAAVSGTFVFTYNGSTALPVNAGTYNVVANFTSTDLNYASGTRTATLIIGTAAPTITVTGGSFVYDAMAHEATATSTGIGGVPVSGTFAFTYNGSTALPVNAGTYNVVATFTSTDLNYASGTGTATLVIGTAAPTITVTGGTFTYDGTAHQATATATGIGGVLVSGIIAMTYDGSSTIPVNAGTYTVQATFTSIDINYASGTGTASLIIERATPSFSNLNAPIIDEGTSTSVISGHLSANTVSPVGGTVTATLNGVTSSGTVDATGNFQVLFQTAALTAGSYPIVVSYAGDGLNFNASIDGSSTLTVNPVAQGIEASGLNISAIAGAPQSNAVATIVNTLGSASAYSATISWGDGTTSIGTITGVGSILTVMGVHTYATPGSAVIQVTITDTLGRGLTATTTGLATVASLGQNAGKTQEAEYWKTNQGQALIKDFNGGASHTELSTWLATSFPNLYGANAGDNNLIGKSNVKVAQFFKKLWKADEDGAAVQILATALNIYATTASLGGIQGAAAGFEVSETGHGARIFDVGEYGAAVGVPNGSWLNVYQMIVAVNRQARNGILYNGDPSLNTAAKELFSRLNSI